MIAHDEVRTTLARMLERYGCSRELADGVVAKIRIVHLEPLLAILTHHAPSSAGVSLVATTPSATPGKIWDPGAGAAPDVGTVIADGGWVRVKITQAQTNSTRTVLRGTCLHNGKVCKFYDSFNHDNPNGRANLDYLLETLHITHPREFIGKEAYAQFVLKPGQGSVKKVSCYSTALDDSERVEYDEQREQASR